MYRCSAYRSWEGNLGHGPRCVGVVTKHLEGAAVLCWSFRGNTSGGCRVCVCVCLNAGSVFVGECWSVHQWVQVSECLSASMGLSVWMTVCIDLFCGSVCRYVCVSDCVCIDLFCGSVCVNDHVCGSVCVSDCVFISVGLSVWVTVFYRCVWVTVFYRCVWVTVFYRCVWVTVFYRCVWVSEWFVSVALPLSVDMGEYRHASVHVFISIHGRVQACFSTCLYQYTWESTGMLQYMSLSVDMGEYRHASVHVFISRHGRVQACFSTCLYQ